MSEVYNTTDSPVVIDDEGHTLGGRERAKVKQTDQVKAATEAGQLVEVETPSSSSSKTAKKNSSSEE